MKKRTIIYIACAVAVALIIAFVIYFATTANKSGKSESEQKIIITRYDEDFNVAKTIEITKKKQIKEINEICENPSLEQNEETLTYAIRNDVKLDLGNNTFFMIQLDLEGYCYYEDKKSNTKLVIKMPEGLLDKVNEILSEN